MLFIPYSHHNTRVPLSVTLPRDVFHQNFQETLRAKEQIVHGFRDWLMCAALVIE